MMRQSNRLLAVGWRWLLTAGLLLVLLGGCGKKGPPIPPNHQALLQVTELQGALQGDTVTLIWRSVAREEIASFDVFKAQSDAANVECRGCPLIFQKVGTATLGQTADRYHFSEPVAAGFIYTYKVQPVGPTGDRGPESNIVVIDRSSNQVER